MVRARLRVRAGAGARVHAGTLLGVVGRPVGLAVVREDTGELRERDVEYVLHLALPRGEEMDVRQVGPWPESLP